MNRNKNITWQQSPCSASKATYPSARNPGTPTKGAHCRCCSTATTTTGVHPSALFPTWRLVRVWVPVRGVNRASHRQRSAVRVTEGTQYHPVVAQTRTRSRTGGRNCSNVRASGCGDGNGILCRHSLPVLVVVHLQSRARDQQVQAKEPTFVVVVVPLVAGLAVAYCARSCPSTLVNCALHIRG